MTERDAKPVIQPLPVMRSRLEAAQDIMRPDTRDYASVLQKNRELAERNTELETLLEAMKARIDTIQETHQSELEKAVSKARDVERASYETRDEEALARLSEALRQGRNEFDQFLKTSDRLVVECLDVVFKSLAGNSSVLPGLLSEAIEHAISEIGRKSVLNVRLGEDDFDLVRKTLFPEAVDPSTMSFEIDPTLQPGECVFELLLGTYELSLPDHWQNARDVLRDALEDGMATRLALEVAE